MIDVLICIFSTLGALLILIASYGVFKMPDFYLRLSVTVKAATLGVGFILIATALYFSEFSVTTKVFAIIFFLLVTAPIAGHMISRTAYIIGVKMWEKSVFDELKGKYNPETHTLEGSDEKSTHDEGEGSGDFQQ